MIKVRFYAAARQAVGSSEIEMASSTINELIGECSKGNDNVTRILAQCSYLVNGIVMHDRNQAIAENSQIDVLPPFAGG